MSSNNKTTDLNYFNNICRTCMNNCDTTFFVNNVISNMFYKLTEIAFETNDELPQQICLKCFKKINEIQEFSLQCKQTHSSLLKCLNKLKTARIKTEDLEVTTGSIKIEEVSIEEKSGEPELNSGSEYFIPELILEEPENYAPEETETINEHTFSRVDLSEIKTEEVPENNAAEETETINELGFSRVDLSEIKTEEVPENNAAEETETINELGFSPNDLFEIKTEEIPENKAPGETETINKYKFSPDDLSEIKTEEVAENNAPEETETINKYKCSPDDLSKINTEEDLKDFACLNDSNKKINPSNNFDYSYIEQNAEFSPKPHKCDACNKSFMYLKSLENHKSLQICELQCKLCLKIFSQVSGLKTHMLTHSGERPHKCDHCSRMFSHLSTLRNHMATHSGERPFKCEQCFKMFSRSSGLKMHMRTHTGERPFQCGQCSMSFAHEFNLRSHVRTHTGERPFECVICFKTFGQSKYLKLHALTHSGERPYKCDYCFKMFTQSSGLKRHLRTHSNIPADLIHGQKQDISKQSSERHYSLVQSSELNVPINTINHIQTGISLMCETQRCE